MSGRVRRSRSQAAPKTAEVPPSVSPAARAAAAAPPPPPAGELDWLCLWPARCLLELPMSWTLRCRHVPSGRVFTVTSNRQAFADARSRREPALHARDWLHLCEAAEDSRACLALAMWLVPTVPPPRPPEPPDWTLPAQPLAALLGPPALELDVHSVLPCGIADARCDTPRCALNVHKTLDHYACVLIAAVSGDAVATAPPTAADSELF